jgi:site-specific recombinase XerD
MVLEDLFRRPDKLARFRLPPLGSQMDGFCDWLSRQGFSQDTMCRRVCQASQFNQFLRRRGIKEGQDIEIGLAERFIKKHLPRCRYKRSYGDRHVYIPRRFRSFIDYLSERGLFAPSSQPSTPQQQLLQEYLDYLKYERNLAEKTINQHQCYLTPFLDDLGAAPAKRLRELSPKQVLAFFTKNTQDRALSVRRCIQGTLRVFLGFCVKQGYLKCDLAQALPKVRTYKLSGVPRGISDEGAHKTLECIDRTTAIGRRDFAIIQLLHTYGVRGGQVRALRLDDIQWRENRIRFTAHKRGKQLIQPLFDEVGEALLDYLRHGRPQAPYPEVFLTTRRPFRPLRCGSTLSFMVAQRMSQAGVSRPKACSNGFRHGFATRMLQHGQSIKTIADLMGHRNINTTFIYTKVDLETLRQVPLDWPEARP